MITGSPVKRSPDASFGSGFRAMLPLWVGVIPFGMAYAVSARAAGLSLFDT
ncbi:MAG: hypothetical protein WD314_09405 [Trueperaceae bacterium]